MSSHGGGGDTAGSHLNWVLFILVALWLVWFFTGGPQRYESRNGPFIKPPTLNTNTVSGLK